MASLDTNILVRFLMQDDQRQFDKVIAYFSKLENEDETVFVSLLVVLEVIWVMSSLYRIKRKRVIESINALLEMRCLEVETPMKVLEFLEVAKTQTMICLTCLLPIVVIWKMHYLY